jgi:hypothetical protein
MKIQLLGVEDKLKNAGVAEELDATNEKLFVSQVSASMVWPSSRRCSPA